ncbi:antirestriction protein [Proteus mirabilis]|uniref:antirestriction protein n=1 Tax=Proteus mirabilis TaxID=584 RepID=UPI000D56420C|nr:antirestriction protein [Proteus mirabilis]PVF70284.1 antirestriction family protein [Proteus mirabilis]
MKHTSTPPTTQGEVFTRNLMAELLEDTEHRSKVVMLQFLIETFYEMRITGTTIPESQEWGLQHVTDKGFYLYPLIKKVYLVRFDNFSISLDNQQLGLGVTLDVLSLVAGESSEPAIYQAYKELREYILSHADTLEGAYTYAKLSHSL